MSIFKLRFWTFKGLEPHAGANHLSIWEWLDTVVDGITRITEGILFLIIVCTVIMGFLKLFSLV